MSNAALMAPVFAMIALTFFALISMGSSRAKSIAKREVKIKDIALGEQGWNDDVKKISNSYASQMQVPLVFYAVIGFYLLLGKADIASLVLAWVFVATRYVHFYIHTTSNYVPNRFKAFVAGNICLMGLWVWLAVRLYLLG